MFEQLTSSGLVQDKAMHDRMRTFMIHNISTHGKLNALLVKVVKAMDEEGIHSVLLKGQGIASIYPVPYLRECGDIDLYVGEKNYAQACRIARSLTTEEEIKKAEDGLKHYTISIDGLSLEVHRVSDRIPVKEKDVPYQAFAAKGLEENTVGVDFGGTVVQTPSDSFNAYFLFHHAFHHFLTGGVGMRQVCDWTRLLHVRKDNIDRDYLREALLSEGVMLPWQAFGYIAVNFLGLPEGEMPFYDPSVKDKALRTLDIILSEGNFGRGNVPRIKRPKGYVLGKAHSLFRHIQRAVNLGKLFPEVSREQLKYTIRGGFAKVLMDIRGES